MQKFKFKVGDRVRLLSPHAKAGAEGIVCDDFIAHDDREYVSVAFPCVGGTFMTSFAPNRLEAFLPSVADDLRLTPQAKSVLLHLRKHGRITPMKADVNYGITRLASCIHEIRKVGYDVETVVERDEGGHKFANYKLATV